MNEKRIDTHARLRDREGRASNADTVDDAVNMDKYHTYTLERRRHTADMPEDVGARSGRLKQMHLYAARSADIGLRDRVLSSSPIQRASRDAAAALPRVLHYLYSFCVWVQRWSG